MAKDVSDEIAKLEERLGELRAAQLDSLREKLTAARNVVSNLEAQIAAIAGKPASPGRRKRTSPAEMRMRIVAAMLFIGASGLQAGGVPAQEAAPPPERTYSLDVRQVPLRRAIARLFRGSGLSYAVDTGVPDVPVTVSFRDLPFAKGLSSLVESASANAPACGERRSRSRAHRSPRPSPHPTCR